MNSSPDPSLRNSIRHVLSLEDPLERTDPHTESTGSVSMNSPMSMSAEDGLTQPKEGEAKWPPENEARLISLMLDEVILGKCINQKFKTSNWMDIQKALNKACGPEHHYEITQITSKHDRLKVKWRRFHNMLHNTTGFGWNSETGKLTGGDEVWSWMSHIDEVDTGGQLNDNMDEDVNAVVQPSHLSRLQQYANMLEFQCQQLMHVHEAFQFNPPMTRIRYRHSTYNGEDWISELLMGHDGRFYDAMGMNKKDCIGAIDGTIIPAWIPEEDHGKYRCRKGHLSQNVMVACDFDCRFTYVLAGWEGSENDAHIFGETLTDPTNTFPWPPEGKYYAVDSAYANVPGFLSPYRGDRYHLPEWIRSNQTPKNARELFNRRHATVRNVVERTFGILKGKFPIIKGLMPNYTTEFQTDIVIACCVVHNFILEHQKFENVPPAILNPDYIPEPDEDDHTMPLMTTLDTSNVGVREQSGLRDSIASALWADQGGRRR
ncbi:Unknown protein [Striga hermonthica]|uniref:Transposase n=1 Tax=Striga hermonthica TaxID=68872 RepID=A0A9N7MZK3_STRHE|nr:Unknown protein [Striga hermonthica]